MKRKIVIVFLFIFLLSCSAFSQKIVSVSAWVDKNKILIGEPFALNLHARLSNTTPPLFFQWNNIPHFEVLEQSRVDTQRLNGSIRLSQRIMLTSWDSGRWQVPSFRLPGTSYKTKPVVIDVVFSAFNPQQEYHDVKDIIQEEEGARMKWYWYAIGALLLAALLALLFPKKKKEASEEQDKANAYKLALAELQRLQQEQLADKDVKAFYVALIDVFRKYIYRRKGVPSFSKTTDYLASAIQDLQLPEPLYHQLLETLQLSDAVKFARFQPDKTENKTAIETIRKSIDAIEQV